MIISSIDKFVKGWYIGNFEPSIHKTDKFEVGIMHHKTGELWPCHYHTSREINYLLSGKMIIQNTELCTGDVFVIEPYEVADPQFLTDCVVVVVKTPSVPGDKYEAQPPMRVV